MVLRTKKMSLKKSLFLLTVTSAFVLSTTMGYCAERLDEAGNNVTVHTILQAEAPVTPQVQDLAMRVIQQEKKIFISYCWDKNYSTVPMVNDFEKFMQERGITEYYRDTRKEEGYGMTLGTNIEDFMKNAGQCDVVAIFLNDAYLRSFNCMREFFQVWSTDSKKISPKALIIRHPDFRGLFARGDAAGPYREHWEGLYEELLGKSRKVPAADRPRILNEMTFASEVEAGISSIINAIAGNIQVGYPELRKNGFEDVFRLALTREGHNAAEGADKQNAKAFQEAEVKKRQNEQRQQLVQKVAKARGAEAEEKDPAERGPEMPLAAQGHEAIYLRFLNGALIYRPNKKNDVGMITFPIAKLANPLEGEFDLSRCGGTGKYLRIATGYRKAIKNDSKIEIWFAPRFLIEREQNASAKHFQPILGNWDERNAVGILWSWSSYGLEKYNYLGTQTMDDLRSVNLYEKWKKSTGRLFRNRAQKHSFACFVSSWSTFHVHFEPLNHGCAASHIVK
jgi:hypothetical protein